MFDSFQLQKRSDIIHERLHSFNNISQFYEQQIIWAKLPFWKISSIVQLAYFLLAGC